MILIFGGAYQGKLEYALHNFQIKENDVFCCGESTEIDPSYSVIYGLENFIMGCVKEGKEAKEILVEYESLLKDKIVIMTDISQGIVPMDPAERSWREMAGRTMLYLGERAQTVIRVFCGLGQKIKG